MYLRGMKTKLVTVATALLLMAALAGCKRKEVQEIITDAPTASTTETTDATGAKSPADYTQRVGIAKIISHPALDAFEQGLLDGLKSAGYVNLKLDMQSANGEVGTAASIANKFKDADLVVGIATPMAMSLANALPKTPILFGAVTDPIDAGLRKDLISEDSNVTGVSDMTPVRQQVELISKIIPVKRLGFVYNPSEANSIVLLKLTQDACAELGIELVQATVSNTSEVKQATESIAQKVDAIYVSTDNTAYAAMPSLVDTAAKYKIPVVAAVPDSNPDNGILATYGVDYYTSGLQGAQMVIRMLNGENPGDIPVLYLNEESMLSLYINTNVAKTLGITVPEDILSKSLPMKSK